MPGDYTVVAHRGYTALGATENTIRALNHARAHGATAVEVDLRITKDGQLVVMHDATLQRTTNCAGWVHKRKLAFITKRCRAGASRLRIPTLDNVLAWAQRKSSSVILETKADPLDRWNNRRFRLLANQIVDRGLSDNVMFHSLSDAPLQALEAAQPQLYTHAIAGSWRRALVKLRWADGVTLQAPVATPDHVRRIRELDKTVLGRESEDPAAWDAYLTAGVDGMLADDVAAVVSFISSWQPTVEEEEPSAPSRKVRD
ncbi:MAG TPA: glycerophosphodiester phosphodiesterase family protein [Marmoricola sp.]|nr:glycerophosphodiester phosphodiesterase family protein [Marmoricola sp.]